MAIATKPKPHGAAHKKRMGQHHRHSKHYVKTYWPYLPLLTIVGLGLAFNSLWSARAGILGATTDISAQTLLADTDLQRAVQHEGSLSLNQTLTQAAQAKANDMARRNYWSHDTPDGKTPWTFFDAAGYHYQTAGENLAYGFTSANQTVTAWMNSPEHRANILNDSYNQVGFGIVNVPDYQDKGPETLVVAFYAKPASANVATASVHQTNLIVQPTPVAEPSAQTVSRFATLSGAEGSWTPFVIAMVSTVAVIAFLWRHGLVWHRVLTKSEAFVLHHPLLDIIFVSLAIVGFVLSQVTGAIR